LLPRLLPNTPKRGWISWDGARSPLDELRKRFQNFKTGALNHSATLPSAQRQSLSRSKIKEATQVRRVGAGTTGGASL
jgi:hypothetical protein